MSLWLVSLLATQVLAGSAARTVPEWTWSAPTDIAFFRVTPLGTLVVSSKDALCGLDARSGTVSWRRDDIRGLPPSGYLGIPGSAAAIVNVNARTGAAAPRFELLDLESGATRWDSRAIGMGAALGVMPVPHRHAVVVYAAPPIETTLVATGDLKGPWTFAALDLADGKLLWTTDQLVHAPPVTTIRWDSEGRPARVMLGAERGYVFDTDSTAIVDFSSEGPIRFDLADGERIWPAAPPESLETLGPPVFAPLLLGDGIVYASREDRLQALSLADGRVVWERRCDVHDVTWTPRGLLLNSSVAGSVLKATAVRAGKVLGTLASPVALFIPSETLAENLLAHRLELIDPRTGEARWASTYRLPTKSPASRSRGKYALYVARGDTIYVGDEGILWGVDLADGRSFELGRFGVEPEETWPEGIEVRASGVVLRTRDALCSVDPTTGGRYGPYGVTRYRRVVPAPGLPPYIAIGGGLLIVATSAWWINTSLLETYEAFGAAYGPVAGPVMTTMSGLPTAIVATGVGGGAVGLGALLSTRFGASRVADSYLYVLTTVRDSTGRPGPGILRIDKDTGSTAGAARLRFRSALGGTFGDRRPVFDVDDIDGRLYHLASPRTIACFPY